MLIIVSGYLAALKTTISTQLSKDLNVLCLNKDHIKEILGDSIGFANREENLKLSLASFLLMKSIAIKEMNLDHSLIIESNFKKHELEELKSNIDFAKTSVYTLFLSGDSVTLYERYLTRQVNRHPVHTSAGLMSYETFRASMLEYKIEDCFGEIIEVNTTSFNEEDYGKLLKKLKSKNK